VSDVARINLRRALAALTLLATTWSAAPPAAALDSTLVEIGSGGKTGVYYLAGGAICSLVNDRRWQTGVRCLTISTNGSIDNLRAIRSGERAFGIAQSDWQYHTVTGTSVFEEVGPDSELRSVFSLYPEPFTVVARPDAEIATLADLEGKRVDIGPVGSGGRATMDVVMAAMGWTGGDFAFVSDLPLDELPRALCSGDIDAAVVVVAHPNLTLEDMVTSCDATLVPVAGPAIDRLVADNPYYSSTEIPAGSYPDQITAVPSFALTAVLSTSSRVPAAVVYELTRAVFENFDAFRSFHPAFAGLDKAEMTAEGLTAPLHRGALRYFEEVGLK
jgi:TRAP transporter TAXI family solute receptor